MKNFPGGKVNSTYCCCLLITFANSLDPDLDPTKHGPDLDQNCYTLVVFLKELFQKDVLKNSADHKEAEKISQGAKI